MQLLEPSSVGSSDVDVQDVLHADAPEPKGLPPVLTKTPVILAAVVALAALWLIGSGASTNNLYGAPTLAAEDEPTPVTVQANDLLTVSCFAGSDDNQVCRARVAGTWDTTEYLCVGACLPPDWYVREIDSLTRVDGNPVRYTIDETGLVRLESSESASGYIVFSESNGRIDVELVGDPEVTIQRSELTEPTTETTTTTTPRRLTPAPTEVDDGPNWLAVIVGAVVANALLIGIPLLVGVLLLVAFGTRSDKDKGDGERSERSIGLRIYELDDDEAIDPDDDADIDDDDEVARAHAEAKVRTINDLLRDLRHDDEPARAIQRAYATLETGFGDPTLARRRSETCATYLDRTIGMVAGVDQPLRVLTSRFELARYSTTPITEQMRSDAIDALRDIRDAWATRAAPSDAVLVDSVLMNPVLINKAQRP